MPTRQNAADTILLVDDEPANLQVLMETLGGTGCKRLIAKNGEAALSIARKALPELILLDIMMPGMDGFEVCRRLKSDPKTADVPVIFLSALSATEDKVQGFALGAVDYVTKPFQPEEVIARVTTHLTIHRLNREIQRRKELLEQELKIVSELQRVLLPKDLPEIGGLQLAVHYETSRYCGGDYYDFVALPDNRWGFLLADAAGHGAPAAVEMAMTCALFRSCPTPPEEPDRLLSYLNDNLCQIYEDSFVTAVYAVFDPGSRLMHIARAGQPPPLIYRASEKTAKELACEGVLPMGIACYDRIPVTRTQLEPGDRLLFYTDGISERTNADGEQYGEARLIDLLQIETTSTPQKRIARIMENVSRFADGKLAEDDQALLLLTLGG
ncbi:MAG: chemotaxis protein [Deltaproteobacteria bacterium SG8_13]|nr:MAG: chemotaxis protein [Deltaproteobacteria bacterium SG8_13]